MNYYHVRANDFRVKDSNNFTKYNGPKTCFMKIKLLSSMSSIVANESESIVSETDFFGIDS